MTVESELSVSGPVEGNDATTVFPFSFHILEADDLEVIHTNTSGLETVLEIDTDYSVLGVDDPLGGSVTYPLSGSPLPTGEKITMRRKMQALQPVSLSTQGGYSPSVVEKAMDRLTMLAQQFKSEIDRCVKVSLSSDSNPDELLAEFNQAVSDASSSANISMIWASYPEDVPIPISAGGDESSIFSALHWSEKAKGYAAEIGDAFSLNGQEGYYYLDYTNFTNTPVIPPAANNATITISAGTDLDGGGTFTVDQAGNATITLDHADTSSQGSVNNSGNTVVQDITLDGRGHITNITSKALSIPSAQSTSVGAVGTYALLKTTATSGTHSPGDTRAGSGLDYASASGANVSTSPSGTWRCMGYCVGSIGGADTQVTLWVRIS